MAVKKTASLPVLFEQNTSNILYYRILLYGCFAAEAAFHLLEPTILAEYNSQALRLPLIEWLAADIDIRYLLAARLFFTLLCAAGLAPNIMKYMVVLVTFFYYNENYYVVKNHHYQLEFWLALLGLLPNYSPLFEKGRAEPLFKTLIKAMLLIVYLYAVVTKITLPKIDFLQGTALAVEVLLIALFCMHTASRLARYALFGVALIFHGATAVAFSATIGIFPYLMIGLFIASFLDIDKVVLKR